jgi:hypothetical protein
MPAPYKRAFFALSFQKWPLGLWIVVWIQILQTR